MNQEMVVEQNLFFLLKDAELKYPTCNIQDLDQSPALLVLFQWTTYALRTNYYDITLGNKWGKSSPHKRLDTNLNLQEDFLYPTKSNSLV